MVKKQWKNFPVFPIYRWATNLKEKNYLKCLSKDSNAAFQLHMGIQNFQVRNFKRNAPLSQFFDSESLENLTNLDLKI